MSEKQNLTKTIRACVFAIIIIASIAIGLYIYNFYFLNDFGLSNNQGDWGTFGDFLGGVLNPIVSLCAFVLLAKSVQIQVEELSNTVDALKESNKSSNQQLQEQQKAHYTSQEAIKVEMLKIHIEGLDIQINNLLADAKDIEAKISLELENFKKTLDGKTPPPSPHLKYLHEQHKELEEAISGIKEEKQKAIDNTIGNTLKSMLNT